MNDGLHLQNMGYFLSNLHQCRKSLNRLRKKTYKAKSIRSLRGIAIRVPFEQGHAIREEFIGHMTDSCLQRKVAIVTY